jgi:hypothetical protein
MFVRLSQAKDVLLLVGAGALFLSAVLMDYFAVRIGDAAGTPKMTTADIRHECSLITDDEFRAGCLQKAKADEGSSAALQ